jgi:hypothetical protein
MYGSLPRGIAGTQIEAYSDGRYICVTGHQWPGTPTTLQNQQAYLDHLVALDAESCPLRAPYTGPSTPPPDDLHQALIDKLQAWQVPVRSVKGWGDGVLAELLECPWGNVHTSARDGAVVILHASGAFDFSCRHAHCGDRSWRDFRAVIEPR